MPTNLVSKLQPEAVLQSEGLHDNSIKEALRHAAIYQDKFWDMTLRTEILGLLLCLIP